MILTGYALHNSSFFAMFAWEFEVDHELIHEDPEFKLVHGGIMSILSSISGGMFLDPMNISCCHMVMSFCCPFINGSIEFFWSNLTFAIVNALKPLRCSCVGDAILWFVTLKMEVISKFINENEEFFFAH